MPPVHGRGEGNCRGGPDPKGEAGMPTGTFWGSDRVSALWTEIVSPGNGQGFLGVTGSLAVGGKELISPWVGKAKNWVWVK